MRKLTVPLCLTLLVFLGSAGESFALPACPSSGVWNNCFGTYTWADGTKYVGEYKDDKRHGQGTLTFANGNKSVGEFRDNKQHGQGTFTYANGGKYVGEFKDDKFHGQGTFTFVNGDKYVGEFRNDNRHGQGTYYSADGTVNEGIWENNKLVKKTEPSPEEETLQKIYDNYLIAKDCNKQSELYISTSQLASIKKMMKKIKNHYIDKLGKDVESRVWEKVATTWKKKEEWLTITSMLGVNEGAHQMCGALYIYIMSFKTPEEKETPVEQDF